MVKGWLLCDYGQVLSTAPPPEEWEALRRLAGYRDGPTFHETYWRHRPAYDRADLSAEEYWKRVLGDAPDRAHLAALIDLDVRIWLHADPASLAAVARSAAGGWRLAILSNAPVEVAGAIDGLDWLAPFERRFYSCHMGRIKPEPEAYRLVLAGLEARPDEVVFFDDRPANVAAALELGIAARLFEEAGQLALC